jgi:hypothetical protein
MMHMAAISKTAFFANSITTKKSNSLGGIASHPITLASPTRQKIQRRASQLR